MPQSKQIKAKTKYQFRGDTINNWEILNPILANREPGLVLDEGGKTMGFKIGDGVTAWNDLEYHNINTAQMNTNFANALKGTKSGSAISVNDVSVVEHSLGVSVKRKNLFNILFFENQNYNGLVCAKEQDDTYSVKGNCSERFGYFADYDCFIPKGTTITVSSKFDTNLTKDASIGFGVVLRNISGGAIVQQNTYHEPNITTITLTEDIYKIGMVWRSANSVAGDYIEFTNIQIQLEIGTTATEYTPYVAELSGVGVSRCGKNLFDINNIESGEKGTFNINEDDSITFYFNSTYASYFPFAYWLEVLPNTDYVISIGQSTSIKTIFGYTDMLRGNKLFSKPLTSGKYVTFNSGNNSRVLIGMYSQVEYRETTATEETIRNIQIELGTIPTNYEPYKEPQTATANADGTVKGLTAIYPTTTITTDTTGIVVDMEYNRDINKAFAELQQAIISLGGDL